MAFTEKPPMLAGTTQDQVNALRDYLFRMASSLENVAGAPAASGTGGALVARSDGAKVYKTNTSEAIEAVRRNAQELKALIIKTANGLGMDISNGDAAVIAYADRKTEEYDGKYLAQSDYGTFTESMHSVIKSDARGVIEEYQYGSSIQSMQNSVDLIQNYYTALNGEIRRGLVEDPDHQGEYIAGIAISQNLQFVADIETGEPIECKDENDPGYPGDGHTYYYLTEGQTFGLYTSTGWQFWIDGSKRGWFTSVDGMLHVRNVQVEEALQVGADWKVTSGITGANKYFEIRYVG